MDSGGAVESVDSGDAVDVDSGDAVDVDGDSPDDEGRDPLRFNHWMKRSATGAVLTGITLGLREALEPRREEPAIMIEAAGEPEDPDQPIVLHFDPDSPADTVAVIRRPTPGPADGGDPPAHGAPSR